jgi:hypothetical protein
MSLCIDDRLVCRFGWDAALSKPAQQTVIYTEWHIPDVVLIQLILLIMGKWMPETCREYKGSTWKSYLQDYLRILCNFFLSTTFSVVLFMSYIFSTFVSKVIYVHNCLLIQTCILNGHLYRVTYTRCRIDTINFPHDGHMAARNM